MLWYVLFLAHISLASPARYIKPCAVSDPNFYACSLESAKEALPEVIKGDPKIQMYSLDPLQILELKQENVPNNAFAVNLKDINMMGLGNAQLQKIEINLKNNSVNLEFLVPVLKMLCKYNVTGRLLILPITGNGDLNSTTVEAQFTFKADITDVERNGKHYVQLENPRIKMESKRVYLSLTNLFNGNEVLGKEMNEFIDKNWKEVNDEVSPYVTQGTGEAVVVAINKLLMTATRDEFFPQTL